MFQALRYVVFYIPFSKYFPYLRIGNQNIYNMFMTCFHEFQIYESTIFFMYIKDKNFLLRSNMLLKLFIFTKKTICSSFKRKQDIFHERIRGFVDLEFVKICHEQVSYVYLTLIGMRGYTFHSLSFLD